MATLNKRQVHGFPKWQDTNVGGIFKSVQCTSRAEIEAEGGAVVGSPTFDPTLGMYANGGSNSWRFISDASMAVLANHGHITMWVEPKLFDDSVTDNQYILNLGTGDQYLQKTISSGVAKLFPKFAAAAANPIPSTEDYLEWPVRMDFNFVEDNFVDVYIDHCLCFRSDKDTWDTNRLTFFGNSGGAFGPETASGALYRVQLGANSIRLPYAPIDKGFAILGDSITLQGGRQADAPYEFGDTNTGTQGFHGWVMRVMRHYAKDFGQLGRLMNFAVTGETSADFADQITACFATKNWTPPYSAFMFGANDTQAGISKATYKADISAGITTLFNTYGQERVFPIKPISVAADTGKSAEQIARIQDYGDALDELAAADSRITVVDGFGALDGDDSLTEFFPDNNLHPNQRGQAKLGDEVVKDLKAFGL